MSLPVNIKLGKKPPVTDPRVPRLSAIAGDRLPAPPTSTNWFAAVGSWPMLANDKVGDCVEAAVLHCIQQFSTYAGTPLTPTEQECLSFYSAATGYNPADPNTDQGSYVLGPDGVMNYWQVKGVTCGGKATYVDKYVQIKKKDTTEWKQAIWLFGGVLVGFLLPEAVFNDGYVWHTTSGPVAGGHEVWIDGYETIGNQTLYDLVSWGQRYRATEEFMVACLDECVAVVDDTELTARGVNAAGLDMAQLVKDMDIIRRQG